MSNEWRTVELGDLLSKKDLKEVKKFIKKDDDKGLREFLRSREKELKAKGVLPDYLYYYLLSKKERLRRIL